MNITALETEYLRGIANSDFSDNLGDQVWTFSVLDACDVTKQQAPGVASSLVQKGLIKTTDEGRDSCTSLTEAGIKVVQDLKL